MTYIFYYIKRLYILSSLPKQRNKKNCRKEKRYSRKRAQNRYSNMQIMTRKTMTLRTLYVHVVLNGVICPQILYHIVLYARHFLLVKFFPKCYFSWKALIHEISKTLSSGIGPLKRVRPFVSMHTAIKIYKGLIEPH